MNEEGKHSSAAIGPAPISRVAALKSKVVPGLLLFAVCLATARLALVVGPISGGSSLFWPPAGIAMAALLLRGVSLWPAVAVASFSSAFWYGGSVWAALGVALASTMEAVWTALMLRRLGFRSRLQRVRDVLLLAGIGAGCCAAISAAIGVTSYWLPGSRGGLRYLRRSKATDLRRWPVCRAVPMAVHFRLFPEQTRWYFSFSLPHTGDLFMMRRTPVRLLLATALLTPTFASAAALSSDSTTQPTASSHDPELLQILNLALSFDADSAAEAIATSHNIRVKGMADDILKDSSQLRLELSALVASSGLVAAESTASQAQGLRNSQDLQTLRATYGSAFNHVYLHQQIDAQYALITLLDQAADLSVLRELSAKVRTAAARHLLFARQLRGDLEGLEAN